MNTQALLPIEKGDNFLLNGILFVMYEWRNGRALATTYIEGKGIITYSLSVTALLHGDFSLLSKAKA